MTLVEFIGTVPSRIPSIPVALSQVAENCTGLIVMPVPAENVSLFSPASEEVEVSGMLIDP